VSIKLVAIQRLLESLARKELKVSPLGSPYDSKDLLRMRGYRWNPELKLWTGIIQIESLENEVEWLKGAVYGGRSFKLEQETITSKNRFSNRKGSIEIVNY
jgi:DNA polymerase-3 subunit epsilon